MNDIHPSPSSPGSRGAFGGAVGFVALIVLFSIGEVSRSAVVLLTAVAVAAHLALLPTVAAAIAATWARPAGYAWLALDVALNGATLNGADTAIVMPMRLGGHLLAAVWIANASWNTKGSVRTVGLALAAMLGAHAFVAGWAPDWTIYPPFVFIPLWLTLLGMRMRLPAPADARAIPGHV